MRCPQHTDNIIYCWCVVGSILCTLTVHVLTSIFCFSYQVINIIVSGAVSPRQKWQKLWQTYFLPRFSPSCGRNTFLPGIKPTLEGEYRIRFDDAVDPIQQAPSRVPVALRDRLKARLDDTVRDDIIEAVEKPTEWISSMVVITKTDKHTSHLS